MKKNLLKKLIAFVAISSIAIGIIACNNTTTSNPDKKSTSSLSEIKQKGKIVIGTSADYPPYEFHKEINGKDQIVGIDINIAQEVAKDLGVELEVKDMDFDGLLVSLQAGKSDMIFAAMNPTDERRENADFSDIYNKEENVFIVRKDDEDSIKSLDDLKNKKIGVQKGSVQETLVKDKLPEAEIKGLGKATDLVLDLKNKKIDAILLDSPVAKFNCEKNSDITLTSITIEAQDDGAAIAMKKGSDELQTEVNKTIKKLKDEGKIDEFVVEANKLMD
jgi:polar amino acid transport system substrate-binding protein